MSEPRLPENDVPRQQVKMTRVIFIFVITGIILFMFAAVLINQAEGALTPSLNAWHGWLSALVIGLCFACSVLAKYLFARVIRLAKDSIIPLNGKLKRHRTSLIVYLAISEAPVLLSIVFFLLTGNFVYQVYACVFLGFILIMFPTRKRLVEQLGLDGQQQMELD